MNPTPTIHPHGDSIDALTGLYLVIIGIGLTEAIKAFFSSTNQPLKISDILVTKFVPFIGYLAIVLQFTLGTFSSLQEKDLYKEIFFFLSGTSIAFMGFSFRHSQFRWYFYFIIALFIFDLAALLPECNQCFLKTIFFGIFEKTSNDIIATYRWWCSSDFYTIAIYGVWWLLSKWVFCLLKTRSRCKDFLSDHPSCPSDLNHIVLGIIIIVFCVFNLIKNSQFLIQ